MEVHFHSDSSNNDWGVRLSAYGVMQVRPSATTPQWREEVVSCGVVQKLLSASLGFHDTLEVKG